MKTKKIESELKMLDSNLKGIARGMGTANFAKETDLKPSDISAWINGHRNFSYEKLIRIALKISDKVIAHRKKEKNS